MNRVLFSSLISFLNEKRLSYSHIYYDDYIFSWINNPVDATKDDLIFIGEERSDYIQIVNQTKSKIIISSIAFYDELNTQNNTNNNFILVDNPRYIFSLIYQHFLETKPTPFIAKSAKIAKSAVIGKGVKIGENVIIEENTVIGDYSFIDSNVVIKEHTHIGDHVKIYAGAIIGSDGFGFIKYNNETINFPHVAGVEIHDFAEIGANTVIDRGALTNTIIGKNTKIDNLCHIAHNVKIGINCYIIANSMIGGSTKIDDNSWIAPSSSIRDGLKIGSNVTVGMGAVVTKNIPDNEIWMGSPARPIEEVKLQLKKIANL